MESIHISKIKVSIDKMLRAMGIAAEFKVDNKNLSINIEFAACQVKPASSKSNNDPLIQEVLDHYNNTFGRKISMTAERYNAVKRAFKDGYKKTELIKAIDAAYYDMLVGWEDRKFYIDFASHIINTKKLPRFLAMHNELKGKYEAHLAAKSAAKSSIKKATEMVFEDGIIGQ